MAQRGRRRSPCLGAHRVHLGYLLGRLADAEPDVSGTSNLGLRFRTMEHAFSNLDLTTMGTPPCANMGAGDPRVWVPTVST